MHMNLLYPFYSSHKANNAFFCENVKIRTEELCNFANIVMDVELKRAMFYSQIYILIG